MMSSEAHQALMLWIARKMTFDGLHVIGYDGCTKQGGRWNSLPPPPVIEGIRPDIVGLTSDGELVAFGEAKTWGDLDTAHTRLQLRILSGGRMTSRGTLCRLYLAVPRSAVRSLDRVLADVGLLGASRVTRLHVPDILLRRVVAA